MAWGRQGPGGSDAGSQGMPTARRAVGSPSPRQLLASGAQLHQTSKNLCADLSVPAVTPKLVLALLRPAVCPVLAGCLSHASLGSPSLSNRLCWFPICRS